jgi:ABC-type sugar transport system permease subunit
MFLFILPAVLIISIFKYYPFASSLYHSFFNWNGANINIFLGFKNYLDLFRDSFFHAAFGNILKVCAAVLCINLFFPFCAAELINNLESKRARNFFRLGFIVPMVIPGTVITLLWRWIFAGDYGVLNMLLKNIGLNNLTVPWLGTPKTALGAIVCIGFPWISGLSFLLYLSGLQAIPRDLYEMADIAGLSRWKRLVYIDIPLVASQRKLVITYMLIQGFQMFEQPFILTYGGPGNATLTPALLIYKQAFDNNQFGYSSATGVVLFVVVMIITLINQHFLRENERGD